MSDDYVLPDQEPGSAHPRSVYELFGHEDAELALSASLTGGRQHHAWLITGPKGVGKATLAYRFARRLLGAKPLSDRPLSCDRDDPIARKIAQGAHPDLRTVSKWNHEDNKPGNSVTVAGIRKLSEFFSKTADGDRGVRIGIVDCADDMNTNASNALLKTLEEPPPGGTLILIAHAPGRLLPTIRSRCRKLILAPLKDADLAHALPNIDSISRALARGCPGRAKALAALGGEKIYTSMSRHLSGLPRAPLDEALGLGELASNGDKFNALFDMLEDWLARAGRAGLGLGIDEIEPGESAVLARLSANAGSDATAIAWTKIRELRQRVDGLNLDKGLATLDALRTIRAELSPIH
jgi:DNA polymerase III subunit delta'